MITCRLAEGDTKRTFVCVTPLLCGVEETQCMLMEEPHSSDNPMRLRRVGKALSTLLR